MDQRENSRDEPCGQPPQFGDQTQFTGPAYQQPYQPPQPPKKTGLRIVQFGCLGVIALAVILIVAAAVSGSKTGSGATGGASSTPTPVNATFASADALISDLGSNGLLCSASNPVVNSTVAGATSMTDCASSTGSGSSDTVVVVFDSHADAQAWGTSMLSGGLMSAGGEMVVGSNWAINTAAPYGDQVAQKIGGTVQDAPSAAATTAAAAPAMSAAPVKTVVLTKSGNGIESTPSFTVGDSWALQYSFDCSNFGSQGNFQVFEDYPGGNVLVNSLSAKGSDTTYQTVDAGTHSLKVNSECNWTIKVIDGDTGQ